MDPYVTAALIAAAAAISVALINRWANRKTYAIVKGNGKGDISTMAEKALAKMDAIEAAMSRRLDRVDAFADRQDEHMERQDAKLDKLTDRVNVIEAWGYTVENRESRARQKIEKHLDEQMKTPSTAEIQAHLDKQDDLAVYLATGHVDTEDPAPPVGE